MGKGRKSEYIKFKYDKSKHCQCGTGKDTQTHLTIVTLT
jgi:hypothetical protein